MLALNYLPPILQEIKEFKVITACDDSENAELKIYIDNLYKDQFITTTETAIKRYEDMLGIAAKETDTLEDRRFRVLALYNRQLPYTLKVLEQNLTTLCGENGYKLNMDYVNKILIVKITIFSKLIYNAVWEYLEEVVPMNLILDFSYNSNVDIPVGVRYTAKTTMQSDFYPRYNLPLLLLDGSWDIDGIYSLNGYKTDELVDFYSVNLDLKSEVNAQPDIESILTIEKDLWYLDGTYLLDGTKLLDAEIIMQTL